MFAWVNEWQTSVLWLRFLPTPVGKSIDPIGPPLVFALQFIEFRSELLTAEIRIHVTLLLDDLDDVLRRVFHRGATL